MRHILVVDDEPQIRGMLGTFLRRSGFEVSEAEDGDAALKVMGKSPIDLMILDLLMPGKEGLETLMALRNREHQFKIIAVSGGAKGAGVDFLPAALKLGADKTLKKPFSNADLLEAIEDLL